MIKLFSLKNQKVQGADNNKVGSGQKKASAAQLRVQKGIILHYLKLLHNFVVNLTGR